MAEEKKEVIVTVGQNEHLPVILEGRFPVVNDKATWMKLRSYIGLRTMVSEKGHRYVVAIEGDVRKWWGGKGFDGDVKLVTSLPRGTIITLEYRTGSHSKAYHSYVAAFVVREQEGDVTLEDMTDGEDVTIHVKNLRILNPAPEEEIARINALFANKYNARPSKYEPVAFFYYVWVERGLAQPPKPAPPPPPQPEEGGEPFELSISAPAAAAPAPAPPAAVETVEMLPAVPEAPAPEAETQALVEEAKVELSKILAKAGYAVVKIFAFD
ncbi:MAG: hypothetical protein QXF87_04845, partial [Thermofilaceae archaeon]